MKSASLLFYGNNSQAEDTIAKYRGGEHDAPNPLQLPLWAGPGGLMYPYGPDDPDYLSIYQVGFKGCLQCGQVGHYNRAQCPLKNDNKVSKLFWTELWIHKPHTKRKNMRTQERASTNAYGSNHQQTDLPLVPYGPPLNRPGYQQRRSIDNRPAWVAWTGYDVDKPNKKRQVEFAKARLRVSTARRFYFTWQLFFFSTFKLIYLEYLNL